MIITVISKAATASHIQIETRGGKPVGQGVTNTSGMMAHERWAGGSFRLKKGAKIFVFGLFSCGFFPCALKRRNAMVFCANLLFIGYLQQHCWLTLDKKSSG